jgi:PAS domain S-box-containing protein
MTGDADGSKTYRCLDPLDRRQQTTCLRKQQKLLHLETPWATGTQIWRKRGSAIVTFSFFHGLILSLLPCLIPPYAFRLSRTFGTRRVGWILVAVFSSLAGLMLVRAWQPFGLDSKVTLDLLNFLIPVLLLIGMVHIETLFKERLRLAEEEKRLRTELQSQIQARTADLDKANGELQHEISLRKQGEEELRKSKEQYRFLFDENPQPMWIFALDTFKFLAFNRATLRHYGYSNNEFRELTARDLCPAEDVEVFVAEAGKASLDLPPRKLSRHCKKDGSVIEVEMAVQDLVYAGCTARLVLTSDVTAQRALQKQLLQSQKWEVTLQLAGGVADNFSKLITAIERDAYLLAQKSADSPATEPLKRVAATAGSASALTRQLLALVRRHPMRPQSVDLNNLLDRMVPGLSRTVGNKIKIVANFSNSLLPVMGDPGLIEQIVRNLTLNARDAMPEGGTLSIGTDVIIADESRAQRHEGAKAGTYVCLAVSDTGCGMTPEIQAQLFEPFFTTKGVGKATGLGLSTVDGLVKQHSGWIEVVSAPGAGSQFSIFFPCAPVVAGVGRWG